MLKERLQADCSLVKVAEMNNPQADNQPSYAIKVNLAFSS